MKTSAPQNDLLELLESLSQGTLGPEQAALLENLLAHDPAARELYVAYMHLRVNSQYLADVQRGSFDTADLVGALVEEDVAEDGPSDPQTVANGGSRVPSAKVGLPVSPPFPSLPAFGGTFGYFAQTVPFSYLVATVLVGLGLFAASMITISPVSHIVSAPAKAPAAGAVAESVGRITGMADCRWLGASASVTDRAQVPLGRKFALAAGMLEITYHSGAKVLLQGPATYHVESASGGYLSVGKLTARLEKKPEVRGQRSEVRSQKSEAANQKSEIKNQKFTVRTPTAIVTDLGTEFGIEVSKSGVTCVHVIQGVVDTQVVGQSGKAGYRERLTEGRAVEIRAANTPIEKVAFAPQSFARNLQPAPRSPAEAAYIKAVLADRPMGYWPLNEPAGAGKCTDRSGKELHGFAMRKTTFGQPGPFGDNSSALALDGNGYIDLGRHDEFAMKNNFTLEAWAWIGRVAETSYVISALGRKGDQNIGWGLIAGHEGPSRAIGGKDPLRLYLIVQGAGHMNFPISEGESLENRWIHVAVAFDRDNKAQFYLNGVHRGSTGRRHPSSVGPMWLQIGCAEAIEADFWHGRLAHVAVYPRTLTKAEIKNHYDQCKVDAKEVADKHP